MLKILFELLIDPLGLPIDCLYEYLILMVIGMLAYFFAYEKTGSLMARGIVSRGIDGRITHWTIRFLFFVTVWAITRIAIWIYGFIKDNKGVSIFAVFCIMVIIVTIKIFKVIEDNKKLEAIRIRGENKKEEDE